jgi:vacuolar protein sorting-associated protein 18
MIFMPCQANLDKQVVYELILSHGRTEVFLHYATVIGDYQRVVEHWVLEEDWEKAIESLSRQVRHSNWIQEFY